MNKIKARIVERIFPDGSKKYVIQQKHFLFRWIWVDAWVNSLSGANCQDSFSTLEQAQNNLCWFNGTPYINYVIQISKNI